jgi:hypothetical protein
VKKCEKAAHWRNKSAIFVPLKTTTNTQKQRKDVTEKKKQTFTMTEQGSGAEFQTLPNPKEKREKKKKEPKFRRHIYLTQTSINLVDELASEITGSNFSMMIQILVGFGLKEYGKQEIQQELIRLAKINVAAQDLGTTAPVDPVDPVDPNPKA